MQVTINDIKSAAARIKPYVLHTPLVYMPALSRRLDTNLYLKLESLQETGSFKIRGATNAILQLDDDRKQCGVITASSGNHGPALARASQKFDLECTVCLSEMVPANKADNVRLNDGMVHVAGRDYDAAAAEARRLAMEKGLNLIPAFDHPHIVAGAGTVGLEIIEDMGNVDTILVPLSGGGLLAGIAIAAKAFSPRIRVIGVSMERGASMHESRLAGQPVEVGEEESLADALGGNIGLDNRWTFETVYELVDDTVVVPETTIAEAMRQIFLHQGLVVEGAGAVGLAALLSNRVSQVGSRVVVVASGRNVDINRFRRVVLKR